MRPNRPTSVLVIAILQFVFGGLGLACGLCSGAGQLAGGNKMFRGMGGAQGAPQEQLQDDMEKFVEQRQPHAKAVQYAEAGLSVVFAIAMLVSGVGLLNMKPWGHWLAIAYAVGSILNTLLSVVYAFAVTVPVFKEFIAQQRAKGGMKQEEQMVLDFMEMGVTAGSLLPLLFMVYPIIVLVLLLRPPVVAAFRGETVAAEPEDYRDQPEDRWER